MQNRRNFLGRLAAVTATAPVAVVAQSALARQPIVEPITPDQYIAERVCQSSRLYATRKSEWRLIDTKTPVNEVTLPI
jgi:hypothetical protein